MVAKTALKKIRKDIFVGASREYGKDLFRHLARGRELEVMRDRVTNRIAGVRTVDQQVFWRPKLDGASTISNVEFLDGPIRYNVHIKK